jgi:hypothetical protein
MPTKNKFFPKFFGITFTSVFIDKVKKGYKIAEIKVFLLFCSLMEGSGSVQNNDGSGSGRPKNIRIHNTGLFAIITGGMNSEH